MHASLESRAGQGYSSLWAVLRENQMALRSSWLIPAPSLFSKFDA